MWDVESIRVQYKVEDAKRRFLRQTGETKRFFDNVVQLEKEQYAMDVAIAWITSWSITRLPDPDLFRT